jgi:hypothetical protein
MINGLRASKSDGFDKIKKGNYGHQEKGRSRKGEGLEGSGAVAKSQTDGIPQHTGRAVVPNLFRVRQGKMSRVDLFQALVNPGDLFLNPAQGPEDQHFIIGTRQNNPFSPACFN